MTTIKLRRGTAAQWTTVNPILAQGEPGFETDTGKHKIGNGITNWAGLKYYVDEVALSNAVSGEVSARDAAINTAVSNLINGAPTALDTLLELSAQLADDESAVGALVNSVSSHVADHNNPHVVTKDQVGLGNVPNIDTTAAIATAVSAVEFIDLDTDGVPFIETGVPPTVNLDTAVASYIGAPGGPSQIDAKLATSYIPAWKPFTSYASGAIVMAPDGSVVKRLTSGTSGLTYTSTNWQTIATVSGTQANTELNNAYSRKDSGPTINVKAAPYNAVGDGVVDDTVAIRTALDDLTTFGGGTLYFPKGTYRVTRILHPVQPATHGNLAANLTIFKVGSNTRLIGEGRDNSVISAEFVNLAAGSNSSSMHVFDVSDGFIAEGIKFKGNYNPGTWAFIPGNNNNAMIGSLVIRHTNQSIRFCAFENIPGFYVGTSIIDHARFTDNDVRYCANGYNSNGKDVLVARNTFYYSEGVESGPDHQISGVWGGRIAVVDNHFYECSIAASLGGNQGTTSNDVSYGFVFTGNTVHNEAVMGMTPVVLSDNAAIFNVSGNTFYGKFRYAVNVYAGTSSARDGSITSNTIYQTYDGAVDGTGACLSFSFSAGICVVQGNMLRAGNAQTVLQMSGTSPAEVYLVGNTMFGRQMVSYTTAQTAILDVAPSNVFTPTDSPARYHLASGGGMSTSTHKPSVHRMPVIDFASADSTPEFIARIASAGSQTDDTNVLYKRYYSGKHQWGPAAGGAADTTLQRVATGVLGVGSNNAFKVGVTTSGGRPDPTLAPGMIMFDSDIGSLIVSSGTAWIPLGASTTTYADLGIPSNGDPRMMTSTLAMTSGNSVFSRVTFGGTATISTIAIRVNVSSGNICLGYYNSTGSGINTLPNVRQQTSGSIACPATGRTAVALGGSVAVVMGGYFAMAVDNATATFAGANATSASLTQGLNAQVGSAFPLPATAVGAAQGNQFSPYMQGV